MKKTILFIGLILSMMLVGASLEDGSVVQDSASDPTIRHIPKFVGEIWFVDASVSASGDGKSPDGAFKTITEATTASAAGDAITVKAGTYAENLTFSKNAVEFWPEIGTIIAPAAGVPITISGNFVKVECPSGALRVDPTAAVGVLVTGNFVYLNDIRVRANSSGTTAFDLQGDGADVRRCRASDVTTAAFKVSGDRVKLEDSCTGGNTTSIGFWITGTADKTRLKNCGSQGHQTAGYQVDTGATNGVIEGCYSGGGDGKWTDADNSFVWSNFSYERLLFAYSTFDGSTGYNIFKITGAVKLKNIFGHVTTQIANTSSTINLELYSTNGSEDITNSGGGPPNVQNKVVGTVFAREEPANEPLLMEEPNGTPAILESANFRDPNTPLTLIEDNSADTYIRVVLSDAVASGAIHWHIEWEPITDDGFVIAQ